MLPRAGPYWTLNPKPKLVRMATLYIKWHKWRPKQLDLFIGVKVRSHLGVRDSSVKSPNIMLVILGLKSYLPWKFYVKL
jgi:hypothetical protein